MRIDRQIVFIFPLLLFSILMVFLWKGLRLDPHKLPSALLNKPVPQFQLTTVQNEDQFFTDKNLRGQVVLLNVWATWCESCQEEHPELMEIARDYRVTIYGLDYKDTRASAKTFLQQYGNPYTLVGFDGDGDVAIDWGVYGTPETFIIDKSGIIRYKYIGPLTDDVWVNNLLPIVKSLQENNSNMRKGI